MNKEQKELGKRIRMLRRSRDVTQKKLGLFLGFSEGQISYIESGARRISKEDLNKVLRYFRVSKECFYK